MLLSHPEMSREFFLQLDLQARPLNRIQNLIYKHTQQGRVSRLPVFAYVLHVMIGQNRWGSYGGRGRNRERENVSVMFSWDENSRVHDLFYTVGSQGDAVWERLWQSVCYCPQGSPPLWGTTPTITFFCISLLPGWKKYIVLIVLIYLFSK